MSVARAEKQTDGRKPGPAKPRLTVPGTFLVRTAFRAKPELWRCFSLTGIVWKEIGSRSKVK
jgi:hypothetical protein